MIVSGSAEKTATPKPVRKTVMVVAPKDKDMPRLAPSEHARTTTTTAATATSESVSSTVSPQATASKSALVQASQTTASRASSTAAHPLLPSASTSASAARPQGSEAPRNTAAPAVAPAAGPSKSRPSASAPPASARTPTQPDPFSYRHYNAYHPTANKLLSKKWEERSRSLHLKKLKEVRATIDNAPPKVYPHLEMRLKKLKLEEDRLVDIKRKNQILLERIAFQMVRISDVGQKGLLETPAIRSCSEKRRRDKAIIASQNLEIYERIENKSPFYNRFEWLADRRRNLGYLKNISQYPKHYFRLINEFDNNEDLVRLSKAATRPTTRAQTAFPALRGAYSTSAAVSDIRAAYGDEAYTSGGIGSVGVKGMGYAAMASGRKPRPMTAAPVRPKEHIGTGFYLSEDEEDDEKSTRTRDSSQQQQQQDNDQGTGDRPESLRHSKAVERDAVAVQ
ncbi:hypothetical protein BC831DRAFT_446235 [Entophlyctis helioformis]|nr:hypothetical protein BC831DRAFT_446235 [Entophlyctis helioformis]